MAIDLSRSATDWVAVATRLGETFADRAAAHDAEGSFVADNYALLREHRLFSAGIPIELGGGGAAYDQVCGIVRILGRSCASTALSFAMHSHPVSTNVFKYRRGDEQARKALTTIAERQLIVAGTGANDWLDSNGDAVAVEGGYRVTAHKRFVSGGPGADLFVTSAIHDGDVGPEVLHFAIPMSSPGIDIRSNWNTLGMRGTGSNDVLLNNVFVPAAAVTARRPVGTWHPMWDVIVPIALPIIVSCYVGLAERAAEMAIDSARGKPWLAAPVGELRSHLTVARLALDDMVRTIDNHAFKPDIARTDEILICKAVAARSVRDAVETASEIVGGAGFFRKHPLERMVRDVRAFHFHPLPERKQRDFSGRLALGLEPVEEPA